MAFGTFEFFIFLAATIAVYWFLKPYSLIRRLFLISASVYYYWLVDSRFAGLIALAALLTFVLARVMKNPGLKNFAFYLGISLNLGILLWFKYYDFFRVSAQSFLNSIGSTSAMPFWEIAFPIGISFYSFRMISYLIDVKRQKYGAEIAIADFFAYAFFFPYMLAGPITRANEFLPQLKHGGPQQPHEIYLAATMMFLGLFKKIIVSSWLAENLVDNAFSVPEQIGAAAAWLATIGYTLQIYCDFSGYSDIAIAAAMFMGFKLSPNFNFPYLSKSVGEFWRRWHISFYSWMLEYVYIPLGGNRKGIIRSLINTMTVFALSGLWHGAAMHYILWGFWHGIGVCTQNIWSKLNFKLKALLSHLTFISDVFGWFFTFLFVGLGWILFRAENFDRAKAFVSALFNFEQPSGITSSLLVITALIFAFIVYEQKINRSLVKIQNHIPEYAWSALWIAAILAIYNFAPQTVPPFIYFSF